MNAMLKEIPPRADSPKRYPGKTDQERARLIRVETQLISRFHKAGIGHARWRCHACHTGRVLIEQIYTTGRIVEFRTRGKCETPNCLDWED
jgi:hypothetical protein